MIKIDDLSFYYTEDRYLFSGFNLMIPSGSRIHIAGPSGVGKTTLLRLVMGLEKAKAGKIINDAKRIAPVFQEDRLIEDWNAIKNIQFGNKSVEHEILQAVQISHLAEKKVSDLSGGERRRIALCRALNHKPDLLILDEPFNGIDENNIVHCINAIEEYAKHATILLVTHHDSQAEKFGCEKVYIEKNV